VSFAPTAKACVVRTTVPELCSAWRVPWGRVWGLAVRF
jgi:hypothetical protein